MEMRLSSAEIVDEVAGELAKRRNRLIIRISARRRSLHRTLLLQCIDGESTEQLGIEIGGLLRQYFSSEGNIANLLHAHRIHKEGHLRYSRLHLRQRFGSLAAIGDI